MSQDNKAKGKKSSTETQKPKEDWFELAKDSYLPKMAGLNYYLITGDPEVKRGSIDGRETVNVEMDASYLLAVDIQGKKLKDSPDLAVDGLLSLPMSVARKMRKTMEAEGIEKDQLVGFILMVQKTGAGKDTRYPEIAFYTQEEFNSR